MKKAVLFALTMTAAFASPADTLSDDQLVARASAVFATREAPPDRILGMHRGAMVIVDIRCGDICPDYTVRIIHYSVGPGPDCTKLGGDSASVMVPRSIAVGAEEFCIPHVLYSRRLYTDRPYQR